MSKTLSGKAAGLVKSATQGDANGDTAERKTRTATQFRTQAVDSEGRIAIAITVSGKENARSVYTALHNFAVKSDLKWDITTTIQKDVSF